MADATVKARGRVPEITLERGEEHAVDAATSPVLRAAFARLQRDDGLSVGIVTARGRFFSAGWDLKAEDAVALPGRGSARSEGEFAGLTGFWGLTKHVIAAVNGNALGGGFELVLAADMVVAAVMEKRAPVWSGE